MGEEKGAAAAAAADDLGEGMVCTEHPYRSNPGGICAFCLQEKLGKLVSSSKSSPFFPLHPQPSSATSSPPSFRSVDSSVSTIPSLRTSQRATGNGNGNGNGNGLSRSKIPSFLGVTARSNSNNSHHHKKKTTKPPSFSTTTSTSVMAMTSSSSSSNTALSLKRSKSVAPKPAGDSGTCVMDSITADSPRKKSFWSFLYHSSGSSSSSSLPSAPPAHIIGSSGGTAARRWSVSSSFARPHSGHDLDTTKHHRHNVLSSTDIDKSDDTRREVTGEEESPGGSHASSSFGRKVARSRSVGCGSRSFSGDFLERLSNGFGDCTLRRVESHRESNNKHNKMVLTHHLDDGDEEQRRIRCSGFFGGLGMISSGSSSYWLSTPTADSSARISTGGRSNRGWSWAFASPMRALRPASSYSSVKSIPSSMHLKSNGSIAVPPQPSVSEATAL